METIVKYKTRTNNGKEYIETITEQIGLQEIEYRGETIVVERLMTFESKLGKSICFTRAHAPFTEEERAAGRRRIQEVAVQAMIDQGIW